MGEVIRIEVGREPQRCTATTKAGARCRNRAIGDGLCRVHQPGSGPPTSQLRAEEPTGDESIERFLDFLGRRLAGDYVVDEFGFDEELTETVLAAIARPLYRDWWRTEWVGMENVPAGGAALLVANHAGTVPWDAVMMKFGLLDLHPAHRHVRLLAADLVFRMPFIGELARKSGNTLATEEDAFRLLDRGELLGVFPEGFKGVGKLYRDRYKLQRFGRGGFIQIALRAKAPIIPVSIVGSEEIHPLISRGRPLARMFGLPYFPITTTFPWLGPLGLVPLPSKWIIEFGEPIPTDGFPDDAWQDALTVFELTDQVRDTIQQTLHRNLARRGSAFRR
ncbi:MAG TPA: lysophospholipid acyltransferase family protein [Actinomycetota bacterium]|nr:lysophospholipid acyltransferase family protein [Actinomycetota bacterium]